MKVESINKENMTIRCDGIEYPVITAAVSVDDMQKIVDKSEQIVNKIISELAVRGFGEL